MYLIFSVLTAKIGYAIHGSIFWAIMDFLFTPFAWIKWILLEEININIIKQTFSWFF